jgi:chemotaxis protein methyltransferase WspC
MKRIETVLSREIGLAARSIGAGALTSAVTARMNALRIDDSEHYANWLAVDAAERLALIEEVVVSETWFFRDEEVFRALAEYVTGPWRAAHAHRPLRVLSIPCATGEEAYSVAMLLFEQGLSRADFQIYAVDVSTRALLSAERASYGRNSFRGQNTAARLHYFEPDIGDDLRPIESVRQAVSFAQGNVLDPNPPWAVTRFDVILCRNLLIYLDQDARRRALDNLKRWLVDDGILFAGHAETLDTMDPGLQRADRLLHFGYVKRKATHASAAPATPRLPRQPKPPSRSVTNPRTKQPAAPGTRRGTSAMARSSAAPAASAQPSSPPDLAHARSLANRGQLVEAAALCERHLAAAGASADAYCLLGIVKQAAADGRRAMECFDKALYLDPEHYEALVHLALLYEQRGDRSRAENLRRRAQRAQPGRGSR